MERMRHLDGKMKHQIDRLLSTPDESFTESNIVTSSSRPNIRALIDAVEEDEDEDDTRGKETKVKSKSSIYRVPKNHAVPYKVAHRLFVL